MSVVLLYAERKGTSMTAEELNERYTKASWLIAKLSASVAGKALVFSTESSQDAMQEIAAVYELSDDEFASLNFNDGIGAVASVQKTVQGLLGDVTDASPTMKVARTAIKNGQTTSALAALWNAGPQAAKAAAAGGHAISKGTPWVWIATAGYAVGSAGWFAYNARAFNLRVFELVREREGIVVTTTPEEPHNQTAADETITFEIKLPTATAITARATMLSSKAGAAVSTVFGKLRGSRS